MIDIGTLDGSLVEKVKEIVVNQWGRSIEDIKDLRVKQFYERLEKDGRVSYRPTNRFMVQAQFFNRREPRRAIFNLTA